VASRKIPIFAPDNVSALSEKRMNYQIGTPISDKKFCDNPVGISPVSSLMAAYELDRTLCRF
jgi:hypothetical protein